MLYIIVYLYDSYDRFLDLMLSTAGLSAIIVICSLIALCFNAEYRSYEGNSYHYQSWRRAYELANKTLKRFTKIGVVAILLFTILPSKQGLTMLGGVYVGSQVYDKIEHSTLVDKSIKILDNELNKYLDAQLASKDSKDSKDSKESN